MMKDSDFKQIFLNECPILDVRSEDEFARGALPGAVNFPILENTERVLVGTLYKKSGREFAIQKGEELVSGEVRARRLQSWAHLAQKFRGSLRITCARGGLRSAYAQEWLQEIGFEVPRIEGGVKRAREFLRVNNENLDDLQFGVITGKTGSGKTSLLNRVFQQSGKPILDLEKLANHRGSAFGHLGSQPSSASFENSLSVALLKTREQNSRIWVEDESRMVGSCVLPEVFFGKMRKSAVVVIEESLDSRVEEIFKDYFLEVLESDRTLRLEIYEKALRVLEKKLGGLRFQEVWRDFSRAVEDSKRLQSPSELHKEWIRKILLWYYDPLYQRSFEKRRPVELFRGNREEVYGWVCRENS